MTVKDLHTKAKVGMRVYYDALGHRNKCWGTIIQIDLARNYIDIQLEYSKLKYIQRFTLASFGRIDINQALFENDLNAIL